MKAHSYQRYSSDLQEGNQSLARQTDATIAYCSKHGFELVNTYEDKGVSAKDGANWMDAETVEALKKQGKEDRVSALANFYLNASLGNIETPCALIIDSTDRFSRGGVMDGMSNLNSLLKLRIEIHLLAEGIVLRPLVNPSMQELTQHNMQCMMACMALAQGQTDNVNKGYKVSGAFNSIRQGNSGSAIKRVASGHSPWWIDHVDIPSMPKPGTSNPVLYYKQYAINEQRGEIVKAIFKLSLKYSVADISLKIQKKFNENLPPDQIHRIQHNHAVYGTLWPKKTKRKGVVEPIPDHYPSLIKKEEFDKIHVALNRRKTYGSGRKTKVSIPNYWKKPPHGIGMLFFLNGQSTFLKSNSSHVKNSIFQAY